VGLSDHPDPIQVVQTALEVSITHELIQMLRAGSIGSIKFSKIVGVGHSLGSALTNNITATYPKDSECYPNSFFVFQRVLGTVKLF